MKDWRTYYIVPADLYRIDVPLGTAPTRTAAWGATPIPGDPTKALLDVCWGDDPNARAAFEAMPDVLPLGYPWEPLPAEAVSLLASFQDFDAAYADARARLGDDWEAAAAEAYAAAKARLEAAAPTSATIAGTSTPTADAPAPTVANGDSVARALLKLGRSHW